MENTTLLLGFVLSLFGQIQSFLANKQMQKLLNDEELLDATLAKVNKNKEEAARIKAKLRAMQQV